MQQTIEFTVNGKPASVSTEPDRSLLEVLREDLRLTGTKYGCGERQCGACTVLLDGRPAMSCSTSVATVAGKSIETIEGLAPQGELHPVQKAFVEAGALQCGYCTAGMIMAAVGLLAKNPRPSEDEIRRGMQRNVCRCGGYVRIVRAIQLAATEGKGGLP
jgi:aerobic-type carbon monoxide dehydrogenase small subunit (CoxS/CutS family)